MLAEAFTTLLESRLMPASPTYRLHTVAPGKSNKSCTALGKSVTRLGASIILTPLAVCVLFADSANRGMLGPHLGTEPLLTHIYLFHDVAGDG